MPHLQVDGRPVEAEAGDSLLVALLRAGLHPTGGGCLCAGGDCPNCLVTVDGVAYTRACQTRARDGMTVTREHLGGEAPALLRNEAGSPLRGIALDAGEDAGAPSVQRLAGPDRPAGSAAPAHHVHCDTVVIGQGDSGREAAREARDAGLDLVTLDAREGQQVTGVYPGPLVVAADAAGRVLHVHPRREIVVATGAAEIQPVVPGSRLEGLVTARAAVELVAAGIDLGPAIAVGDLPADLPAGALAGHVPLAGPAAPPAEDVPTETGGDAPRGESGPAEGQGGWDLVRFEGDRRVEAVVVRKRGDGNDAEAPEERLACDTVVLGLGRNPRNALARMASDLPVRVVGSAAAPAPELPPCPPEGTVCPCSGVAVADLDDVWERGFREMELLKRATLAGTGACQGGVCLPYLRSFLLEQGGRLQPAFTARPLNRQLTVRELAAGAHTAATARSPLHDEHLRLGARMDRAGGWWRPWTYGRKPVAERAAGALENASSPHRTTECGEYRSVRERVSLGDVSSLGKMAIAGPDAEAFLERMVPTKVATIRPGRCRYVLMLDERGYLLDDGMLCREAGAGGGARFFLTSTSGGSGFFELWLRDWAEAFGFDVRILNQTASLAAINVTGPMAARLLARAGARDLPGFGRHGRARVAGVECRIVRLSFTGELSYELHHAAADARRLWRRLLEAGAGFDVQPHRLEALLRLRLDKGHIAIGQDTDYDSTPRRLAHEWAVDLNKGDFVGRQAILRTNRQPLDKRLVTLRSDDPPVRGAGDPSAEGAAIHDGDRYAGYVTSDAGAAAGGGSPMLGWLYLDAEGNLPREVTVDGRPARRVDGPAYDPDGERARVAVDVAGESPENVREFPAARPRATDLAASAPPGPSGSSGPPEPPRPQRLEATRVAAAPEALGALVERPPWPAGTLAFRTAPDELLVAATPDFDVADDPHAIVERETAFSYVWLDEAATERFLDRECEWRRPDARPALSQGEVAGIPAKLWFERERTLILVPAPFAAAFERRLVAALAETGGGAP